MSLSAAVGFWLARDQKSGGRRPRAVATSMSSYEKAKASRRQPPAQMTNEFVAIRLMIGVTGSRA